MWLFLLSHNFSYKTSRKVSRHIPEAFTKRCPNWSFNQQSLPLIFRLYMIRLKIHGRNTLKRIHKYREHCFLISSPKYRKVKCPSSIKSSEGVVQGFLYLQRLKSYKKGTVALNFCRMQTVPSQNVYVIEDSPISECPPREEK